MEPHPNKCLRCFRTGHTYDICCYTEDIHGNKIKEKGVEELEYYSGKYFVNNFRYEKCPRCLQRKHLNPKCNNSLFIYAADVD